MFHGFNYLTDEDRETMLRGIVDGEVYGGPYHLELDWVDKCNARCFFCNSENLHNGKSILWPRAEEILTEAVENGLRSIRLAGGGEPTLHPHLPDLFRFLTDRGVALDQLTTNGTQFTDRVLESMSDLTVGNVSVSLNYTNRETYEKGMGLPAKFFDRAVEMTRKVSELKKRNPNFKRLVIQFFVYKPTIELIPEMYRLGRELGADLIPFKDLFGIDPKLQLDENDVPRIVELFREVAREDGDKGIAHFHVRKWGLDAAIQEMYRELEEEGVPTVDSAELPSVLHNKFCHIAWYSMTISGTQAVYPCCWLFVHPGVGPVDNLMDKSLLEVWRGEPMREVRQELRQFMLLRERGAFQNRRLKRTTPECHSHNECPLAFGMCDEAFYEEADRRLEKVRRSLSVSALKAMNRVGSHVEQLIRS